jgi:spore coat polysaccharide biosynthesis protein SpsF
VSNVTWENGRDLSMSHRFTIDYPEDYELIREVYGALYRPERPIFTVDEIVALLDREPRIRALNAKYAGVNWYRHHLGELKTVTAKETRLEGAANGPARRASESSFRGVK